MSGGSRWREEQAEVIDFAEKLHYDHAPGGSLISETDDKGAWNDWKNKFGAWKEANVAKEDSGQAWWQTYTAPSEGGSEGGGSGLLNTPSTPDIGPYPFPNRYFPQLTQAYEAPHAQDMSQYMPSNSPFSEFDPLRTYSPFDGMGGLLYQPGTQEYMEQFPMPENLLNYQPPEINRQPVQYMNSLLGPMEVIMPESEDEDEDEDEEEYDPNKDPGWDEGGGGADMNALQAIESKYGDKYGLGWGVRSGLKGSEVGSTNKGRISLGKPGG